MTRPAQHLLDGLSRASALPVTERTRMATCDDVADRLQTMYVDAMLAKSATLRRESDVMLLCDPVEQWAREYAHELLAHVLAVRGRLPPKP